MTLTIILQKDDPTCIPLYVLGSSRFPFPGPFQIVISFECPHYFGIAYVTHAVSYSLKSSLVDSLLLSACLMKVIGVSRAELLFLSSLSL